MWLLYITVYPCSDRLSHFIVSRELTVPYIQQYNIYAAGLCCCTIDCFEFQRYTIRNETLGSIKLDPIVVYLVRCAACDAVSTSGNGGAGAVASYASELMLLLPSIKFATVS